MEEHIVEPEERTIELLRKLYKDKKHVLLLSALFIAFFYGFFLSAPRSYPIGTIYDLRSGETLSVVAEDFSRSNIIRSPFWLKSFSYIFSLGNVKVLAGDYAFSQRQNVIVLAWRITHGTFDIKPVRITIPEGLNSSQIADIFVKNLPITICSKM